MLKEGLHDAVSRHLMLGSIVASQLFMTSWVLLYDGCDSIWAHCFRIRFWVCVCVFFLFSGPLFGRICHVFMTLGGFLGPCSHS